MPQPYSDSVKRLLLDEEPNYPELASFDYVGQYQLTSADVSRLEQLAFDEKPMPEGETYEDDYYLRACCAIAQLAPEIAPRIGFTLLAKYPDDDGLHETLPPMFARIGPSAFPQLQETMADVKLNTWVRDTAARSVEAIAKAHPDSRDASVQLLMDQLKRSIDEAETEDDSDVLVSSLINSLMNLEATEAAGLMAEAFRREFVDEWVTGSWPSVQVELGLKSRDDFSPEELEAKVPEHIKALRKNLDQLAKISDGKERSLNEVVALLGMGKSESSAPFKSIKSSARKTQGFGGGKAAAKKKSKKGKKKKK